ncbi:MAG: M3 family metallopeptidase [Polyangiaceae bacterium]
MSSDNPLLREGFPIPFDQVKAEHVGPAVDVLLAEAEAAKAALEQSEGPHTFDSCLLALEAITRRLGRAVRIVGHLEGVATTPALREAFNEAQPRVSAFSSSIALSEGLWRVVRDYAETDDAKALTGPSKRFLDKTLSYFKRHGAELDEAGKERLAAIDVQLTKLTLRYAQNTLDATNAFELLVDDETKLAGLPESAKAAARQSAEQKGHTDKWRFTLQAPSYIPVLTYLDDTVIRERLYRAMSTRATAGERDNRPILLEILALRKERAKLLGYADFADLVTEERMAKSGAKARAFIDDLRIRTEPAFRRENDELLAFRAERGGPPIDRPLEPWDVGYEAEKMRQARYSFDDEQLKPYFAFEAVLAGLFAITERVYGVRFEPWADAPSWHTDVRSYKVLDAEDGRWLAGIYIDPYPRETKQSGAWMDGVLARGRVEEDNRHIGLIVANVNPPVGDGDALLTHRDVETMFHEFGHLMHHCLSRAAFESQAGTHVAWDFVELPSQIFENFCWEREALDLFAKHCDTGETIPDELFDAMSRARTFRAASAQMRQLGFAAADLALHVDYDPEKDGDVIAYARDVMAKHSPTPLPEDYAMIASFSHLFGDPTGYAAGYYSYKWAEVLDADAFTRFKHEGLLDGKVGREFRDRILARGDEDDPEVLFRDFMGRDPELDALLARLGLQAA